MAEINLERKRTPTGVAAVAALIVLVLAVWWIVRSDAPGSEVMTAAYDSSVGETATATAGGSIAGDDLPSGVETYLAWNDETRADSAMRRDHQYTVAGIRNLAAALEAIATPEQSANVADELSALRSRADTLQQNPTSTRHADRARALFRSLAGLMSAMQEERFPELAADVEAVERAAESVQADRPLLDQAAAVSDFFNRAAVAVRGMVGRR